MKVPLFIQFNCECGSIMAARNEERAGRHFPVVVCANELCPQHGVIYERPMIELKKFPVRKPRSKITKQKKK